MRTIEEKTKNCNSWKKAQIRLNKFNKIVKLIKKYPTKLIEYSLSPLYELNKFYLLNFSNKIYKP